MDISVTGMIGKRAEKAKLIKAAEFIILNYNILPTGATFPA